MEELREVGYALSGCTHNFLNFVVFEGERIQVNNFYFLLHPHMPETPVLARVFRVQPYNPEMEMGRTGPLAGKKRRRADYGKKLEYVVGYAEILGYYDKDEKWRIMEVAPSPWDPVYEPSEEALKRFLLREKFAADALVIEIGKVRGTKIPVYLDLNAIAKAHMFVAGMTRSGKSSFIINMVARAGEVKPRPRFLIFDRRGEYGALKKYGAEVLPYTLFTPTITDPDLIVSKLELKAKEKDTVLNAIRSLLADAMPLSRDAIYQRSTEIIGNFIKTEASQTKALESIRWHLDTKGQFIDESKEPLNIIEKIKEKPTLIIDFSVDTDIESQHRTASQIINQIREYAMERKSEGDFALIMAVEEAQYLAPERGAELRESGGQSEVRGSFIETISQAGGYNIGLIVMTQRPAYCSKSVISQCNSVACFRLKSGNDQAAIMDYTEYGSERLSEYLPGLADHEAMLWGMAIPTPFPLIAEIKVTDYPQKATVFAKQAWEKMEKK
ncbi:MAG: ATP-binding protein [Candidatus Bathyarchaeia archaeon]